MSDSELLYQQSHIADDVRPNLIAACAISLGMSYVAVALRFFARWKARARYGWDDWSILMGLSTATGFVIASFFMISFGLGQHAILVTNVQALIQVGPRCLERRLMPSSNRCLAVRRRIAAALLHQHRSHQDLHPMSLRPPVP